MTKDLPILDPLSKATEQRLKPIALSRSDYLRISLDDNKEDFIVKGFQGIEFLEENFSPSVWERQQEWVEKNVSDVWKNSEGVPIMNKGPFITKPARAWFERIPERKYLGVNNSPMLNTWTLAGTDLNVLMLHHCWPKDRLCFKDMETRLAYVYILRRFFAQNIKAKMQAEYVKEKTLPKLPDDFSDHSKFPLAEYQKLAFALSLDTEGFALFMEPGTGKTAVTIARISYEARRARLGKQINPVTNEREAHMYKAIVVCPKQVRTNWKKEFEKFSTVQGKVTIIKGTQLNRVKLLVRALKDDGKSAFSVIIISYDMAVNDIGSLSQIPWNFIASDESHLFKSPSTNRWKDGMSHLLHCSSSRMILTGTPIANTVMDLWTQLEFLMPGGSGFKRFKGFRSFYGEFEKVGTGQADKTIDKLVGLKNMPLLQERLARVSYRVTKKDANLQLPDKVYDTWEVEMSDAQAKLYTQLSNQIAVEIEEGLAKGHITADHILTKLMRLQQICSGFTKLDASIDPETGTTILEERVVEINKVNPKIEAAVEMVKERPFESKVQFWGVFVNDITSLKEAFAKEGIKAVTYYGATSDKERDEAEKAFANDPECRVFIGNPKSGGAGLNLLGYNPEDPNPSESNCDLVVFYSQDWSMTSRLQAEDRAHRRGTRVPVTIRDLVVLDTIDEEIRNRVSTKKSSANSIQDLSEMLSRVLKIDISTKLGAMN